MNDICTNIDRQHAMIEELVAHGGNVLLAFDFDGVLSPIVDEPAKARPHPKARSLLLFLISHVDSIAIISGRPAQFISSKFGLTENDQITVFGHYGLERLGQITNIIDPKIEKTFQELEELIVNSILKMGFSKKFIENNIIERKEAQGVLIALGVHARSINSNHEFIDSMMKVLSDLKSDYKFSIQPGRKVIEVRPEGIHKGDTLRSYVKERKADTVAYFGDDLGDLPAFGVVDELSEEGLMGLKICSWSNEVPEVATKADIVLDGPNGVVSFLEELKHRLKC